MKSPCTYCKHDDGKFTYIVEEGILPTLNGDDMQDFAVVQTCLDSAIFGLAKKLEDNKE